MFSIHPAASARLAQLRENEIDLQTELDDLDDEITTRLERVVVVRALLRLTRIEIAQLARGDLA
jgi:hypothetical protein